MFFRVIFLLIFSVLFSDFGFSQNESKRNHANKFEQLGPMLRSPNVYRTASGAPGHQYWQQKADYEIEVELNDEDQSIAGVGKVIYYNNSPDPLNYLWIQLDQNQRSKESNTPKTATNSIKDKMTLRDVEEIMWHDLDLDVKIHYVKDGKGEDIPATLNQTMMRLDLAKPLKPGDKFEFSIKWSFNIHDRMSFIGGRPGFEYFEEDGNYIYTMAEWFPRMAVYSDFEGWQNKQFAGRGEFALVFGNYKVKITAPADHMVASTGVLQNPNQVLSSTELQRWNEAKKSYDVPVIIRTQEEAVELEKSKSTAKKTWIFHAENVRDFAWTSSRKFIWDAMAVKQGGKDVMAMSYYPKEGNPLWEQYSTRAVAHTLHSYSARTFDYPYPVAISVEAANGMEYPMICFNYGRPAADGTYSDAIKYGMISVIIHEVGHNYFPMIVNSDERQWTWMDEGLNTFLQFLAEQEWDRDYPSRRGPPHKIVDYMKSEQNVLEPIMTNSENIKQFGANAYAKPATALNILRETIMGRELFDFAFKEYSRRWMFKHPTPEDFFRTMEDASGVDLDWFWRGWFFETEPVDISIESISTFQIESRSLVERVEELKSNFEKEETYLSNTRNREDIAETVVERDSLARDFYNDYDQFEVNPSDIAAYQRYLDDFDEDEQEIMKKDLYLYEIKFKNIGGLVMPVIIQFNYDDGSSEVEYLPAEIWRMNEKEITKVFGKEKKVDSFVLDPFRETADIDETNNFWPRSAQPSRFELFKRNNSARGTSPANNPMQKARQGQ